ncbi:MAG TPA: hypothetical protein VJS38_06950 [Phenylobacterium sp.]|uniref:hypothetical protein n=1 Tax=Phenylobacterium sp. TaxID=1871053 RepID=UPI002B45AF1C|nr:hypothetical protein [Phenylobacterium sp.]HKR87897.1 hypothetical protein [Phenylobacterium sp.]
MGQSHLLERRAHARPHHDRDAAGGEAAEIAQLLERAGVDQASALWFQFLELATQRACDWSERFAAAGAPLNVRAAAVLGLRALAAEILSTAPAQADAAYGAAEACLGVCEQARQAALAPPSPRRWGEGAAPRSPQRTGPLRHGVGCC